MIIFVCLWVLATAAAIGFYIKWSQTRDDDAKEIAVLKETVNTDQRRSPAFIAMSENARSKTSPETVYSQLQAQINQLKEQLDGAAGASVAVNTAIADFKAALASSGSADSADAVTALIALANTIATQKANVAELNKSLADAKAGYDAAKKQYDDASAADKASLADAQNRINQAANALTALQAKATADSQAYEARLTEAASKLEDAQRQLAVQKRQAQEDATIAKIKIADLQHTIELIRPSLATNAAREADGKIVRVSTGTNEVWINLGRKDHVTPDLTFAVYDPSLGVLSGPNEGGKGAIEVVEVGDNESLCRVSHVEKGQTILEDDLIANPVFNKDKNRKFHFVVYGDFDLDGDGICTPAEHDKLIRLINSWGGVVDDKLTSQTDFVVLGAQPGSASSKFDNVVEQTEDLKAKRKTEQDEYNKILSDARAYSIPVLDSTRFLAMIGYYSTTVWK